MEYLELLLVKPQAFPKSVSNREDLPMETKLISIPLDQVLGMNLASNSGWRLERAGIINKTDKQLLNEFKNYKSIKEMKRLYLESKVKNLVANMKAQ